MHVFDLSNPEVRVIIVDDRPTMMEFTVPSDAFERPEGVLFQAVAEYLLHHAFEPLNIDAFTVRYNVDEHGQKLVIGSLYSRVPLPWVEYNPDGG